MKKAAGDEAAAPDAQAEAAAIGYVPDLLEDNKTLEWAGLGLGEEESYLLIKSLKVSR